MKKTIMTFAIVLASCASFAQSTTALSDDGKIEGKKAERIYKALVASEVVAVDNVVRTGGILCYKTTIDQDEKPHTFTSCDIVGTQATANGDYIGGEGTNELVRALRAVGVHLGKEKLEGNSSSRSLSVNSAKCEKSQTTIQNEETGKLEVKDNFTCVIEK